MKKKKTGYTIPISKFSQNDCFDRYPESVKSGICNGFCIDYTRHVISHKNSARKSNYIAKLKRKFSDPKKDPKNFIKRTLGYQKNLQARLVRETKKANIDFTHIADSKFIEFLPKKFRSSSVIGLSFVGDDKTGHIIAIQVIRKEGEIFGYKIFDPNFGEYNCATAKSTVTGNTRHCNNQIKDLFQYYSDRVHHCCVSDLEKLVTKYELVKPKNKSKEYHSEYKYLEHNPLRQAKDKKLFLDYVFNGDTSQVESCLNHNKAMVNAKTKDGRTALQIAIKNNKKDIARLILSCDAIDFSQEKLDTPALHLAAQKGNVEAVNLLLNHPFTKINQQDKNGCTALHLAAKHNHTEIVQLLLDNAANAGIINKDNKSYGG